MKGSIRLGIALALFAVGACASLAVVYSITKPRIEAQDQIALEASLRDLFPEGEVFEDVSASITSANATVNISSAFLAKRGEASLGLAVKAAGPSYGGQAVLLVGVELNRSIAGVRILELNDTAGLGANAKNPGYYVDKTNKITFPGQFAGKYVTDPFVVKSDVVAITASTITSTALTTIVKAAADAGVLWLENSALAPSTDQGPGASYSGSAASESAPATTGGN
ncbi:MAG: FMN-binding protein [Spirochaetia bacterium]|jgi:electron transport complex protein RnfG|nr:FMN-binding protein [Spirochaetales bacterium]MDX9783637.1 FMN-binding protein [Spirochaetia bacterium]